MKYDVRVWTSHLFQDTTVHSCKNSAIDLASFDKNAYH